MKSILFDIDGTIADIAHRRPFVQNGKSDWKSFNAAISDDTPNFPILALYKTLWRSGEYEIILVTGRTESLREETEKWLRRNDILFQRIIFRKDNDFRQDATVKEEILKTLRAENKDILFVVDDRRQVVDMWRRNGLVCLQCDEGNF